MLDRLKEKILVVGGCGPDRDFVLSTLPAEGHDVLCASNVEDALETMKTRPSEIVICDITAHGLDGNKLTASVKSRYPNTVVLIVTSYDSIARAREAMLLGATDYIFKPLKKEEVIKTVSNSIERLRMTRENAQLKEAVTLFQIDDTITSPLKKESLYRIIVESVLSQTRCSLGALVVYNDEKQQLEIAYCSYISGGNVHFPHDYLSYPAVDFVFNKHRPLLLTMPDKQRPTGGIDHFPYSSELFPEILPFEKELVLYPMKTPRSEMIGFIVISKKLEEPSFTQNDLQVLGIIAGQSAVSVHNACLVEGLERSYVNTLVSLNAILEAKHPYTKGHTQRVTLCSTAIARELGLSSDEVQVMRDGAMLHDIGKIGISDAILNKPGSLDEAEIEAIRQHPIIGEKIIRPIEFLERTLPIVRHHHERMDGRGWPDGLAGEQIPLLARICTLADAYDAMASHRSYREAMTDDDIRRELIRHCGTQFDEELVEVFLRLMDQGKVGNIEEAIESVPLGI